MHARQWLVVLAAVVAVFATGCRYFWNPMEQQPGQWVITSSEGRTFLLNTVHGGSYVYKSPGSHKPRAWVQVRSWVLEDPAGTDPAEPKRGQRQPDPTLDRLSK